MASAIGTISQTFAIGGDTYSIASVAAEAGALMDATELKDIAWGTSWTNTLNTVGAIVSTQNPIAGDVYSGATTEITGCPVGTEIKWSAAMNNGTVFIAPDIGGYIACMTKALVQPCKGDYCERTYDCPTVTCHTYYSDGTTAVSVGPPTTPGDSQALYQSSGLPADDVAAVITMFKYGATSAAIIAYI